MFEDMPAVLFVIVPVEDGPVDKCERCSADLHAGDVWTVTLASPPDHERTWVVCGECFELVGRVMWSSSTASSSRRSSAWPSGAGGSLEPGWAPQTDIDRKVP